MKRLEEAFERKRPLSLFEADEQGLAKRTVYFDADQLDAALEELE